MGGTSIGWTRTDSKPLLKNKIRRQMKILNMALKVTLNQERNYSNTRKSAKKNGSEFSKICDGQPIKTKKYIQ
jgi:hypothetical protein